MDSFNTMALPASKKRKTGHTATHDDASFASFGESDEDVVQVNGKKEENRNEDEEEESLDASQEGEEDEEEEEEEEEEETVARSTQTRPVKTLPPKGLHERTRLAQLSLDTNAGAYFAGSFKSNIFKLQVDELLDQIRPRRSRREEAAEAALHQVKKTIEQTPNVDPLPVEEAERSILKSSNVAIPFPYPRPPKDAKYKLAYAKPANINVVGSHAMKTSARSKEVLEIDMTLTMPSSLFQEKDYLNHRYFYKRAYYLACVAASLNTKHGEEFDLSFVDFRDDPFKPVLVIQPAKQVNGNAKSLAAPTWQINIIPCLSADVFPEEKLAPNKNCVRRPDELQPTPTPLYNASLRADMLTTPYIKLIHSAASSCAAFLDGCLLGNTWLRQRGFRSSTSAGGFGNFEWTALVALLLEGGGPGGKSLVSEGYSSYQLFKATLQILATKDISKQALVLGQVSDGPKSVGDGSPMLWDGGRKHNLLYKMCPWSFSLLRQEARTTLATLGDQLFDGFDATFILRCDNSLLRYDHVVQLSLATTSLSNKEANESSQRYQKLYAVLKRGLGDRVNRINIVMPSSEPWKLDTVKPGDVSNGNMSIGLMVNADTVDRLVDHGPPAENKTEAASFRKFWGEKAELRRFKDGSILESLVWTAGEGGNSVLEQIVRYLLRHHFSDAVERSAALSGNGFAHMVKTTNMAAFQPLMEAYKQLETDIRSLDGLPLSIRQIMPADAQLRYASVQAPYGKQRPTPADVTIQFEGSARWPDDLQAVQRTKIAFLLKLSELMQESQPSITTRIGLENERHVIVNQAFLDIIYDSGAAFRLRIHHDREQTLLERILKDDSLPPSTKETAAYALAKYKRDYIKGPAHTQAFARLCSRYPALSGSVRLLKKWFASHLLHNHFADELLELLVVRTFVQPWPWQTPSSIQTGFLRTLHWLSRWDWRAEPLIVDLSGSGELKPADVKGIETSFEAWRKLDPSLNRVVLFAASSVDREGTTWTDGRPAKVVAGRMTALAKAAMAEVAGKGVELEVGGLFESAEGDFDFVLHLEPGLVGGGKRRKGAGANGKVFKNLKMEDLGDSSLVGFDAVAGFLHEIEEVYGSAVLFFSGGHERPAIAGLWNPRTTQRKWAINLDYSTVPVQTKDDSEVQALINKDDILAEMARLGGDMVRKVEVNQH